MTPRPPTLRDEDDDIRGRLSRLEWIAEETEKRLGKGAESFSEIRRELIAIRETVRDATAPRPMQWARIGGILLAGFLAVSAWVWQAARYPERAEFESLAAQVQQMATEQTLLQDKAERVKGEQRTQDSQLHQLEAKVLLLEQLPRGRGR